jgi:WD40 repeat protein
MGVTRQQQQMDHKTPPERQPPAMAGQGAGPDQSEAGQIPLIPDHDLLRCIGRGSYGTVWLARNIMGMYRAVKIVYRKSFTSERPFERELSGIRRFEPISRSHEGFVDILQIGINQEQGYFYYVMELGDDETSGQNIDPENYAPKTLAKEISPLGKLPLEKCLDLGIALSHALAELHKHGLVHRDVKPSNIIFVNGVPKLADIGLVADVEEARSYVGTEGFIPPEGPGRPQADIYSLGKVLYEASTGKDRQEFPELPTQLSEFPDPEGFLELNEVILSACKNDLDKRYQSAGDMHADLLMLANGKSVKRLKLLERRLSNFKRVAGISALVALLLTAVLFQIYRSWRNAVDSQVNMAVTSGNAAVTSGNPLEALPFFANVLRLDKRTSLEPSYRLRFNSTLDQCTRLSHLWITSATNSLANGHFSPDGKKVILVQYSGNAEILDVASGEPVSLPFGRPLLADANFDPTGHFIVTAGENGMECVWDASTLKPVLELTYPSSVFNARFSPDGLKIIASFDDGTARVVDARTGDLKLQIKAHGGAVRFATFSHNGLLILTASEDGTACVSDAINGKLLVRLSGHGNWVKYAAFSPDDKWVVTASFDKTARIWETATGNRKLPDLNHDDGVESAEFSPDGRLLMTACLDGAVRLWDAAKLIPLASNPVLRHGQRVTHACFSPDGSCIVTTCADGSARIWNFVEADAPSAPINQKASGDGNRFLVLDSGEAEVRDAISNKRVASPMPFGQSFAKAELNGNGRFLLATAAAGKGNEITHALQVWNVETSTAVAAPLLISNSFTRAVLSDDGRRLVAWGGSAAQTWDVLKQSVLSPQLAHEAKIKTAVFSPDGNQLAIVSGKNVYVYEATTGRLVFPALTHALAVSYVEFSPDGLRLATCFSDDHYTKCTAQVWESHTGRAVCPPLKHSDGVCHASFSPDNRYIVTAGEDSMAKIWQVANGKQIGLTMKHGRTINMAVFSPDGKWIVTASVDGTARVWNALTGDPITPPFRHLVPLESARFLSDGLHIITVDINHIARIWKLPMDRKPVSDLQDIARLLSADSAISPDSLTTLQSGFIEDVLTQLRSKYPAEFTISPKEIEAWHEFEAEASEHDRQWFAAAFHLRHLLLVQPGASSLLKRLDRAEAEQLKAGK